MNARHPLSWLLASAIAHVLLPATADAASITREFTAAWYDPSRSGHGLGLEVIDSQGSKQAVAYWFTYDTDGKQLWLYGTGPVNGDSVSMTVYKTRGGAYDGNFNPSQVVQESWGTVELSFADCNSGQLRYTPNDPAATAGTMPLSRLTRMFNSTCTGGVSDDFPTGSTGTDLVTFLSNVGPYGAASAKAKYEQRPDRTEFSVELEDLPTGSYALRVNGVARGTISVVSVGSGTRGELEFRSPVEPGKVLLDFDPRNAVIEVGDTSGVLFEGMFGSGAGQPGTPPPTGGVVPTGNARYDLVVEPAGSDGPELHAKLEQRSDRVDFSVELEDVPVGSYQLQIAGINRGTLTVVVVDGGTEGELEFRDPVEPGKQLLDFDPRGQSVMAIGASGSSIGGTFPSTPTGPASSGDDCEDNGDDDACDDDGSGGTPPSDPGVASTPLTTTGVDPDANGHASFEASSNETEFEVEVEDLDDGSYQLVVGGTVRATIQVSGSEGEVKFNNPARQGRLLLDFDPRSQQIEIVRDGTTYLRGTL